MEIQDLNGCIVVSTFMSYDEDEKCGHSYLGVIKNDNYYDFQEEGNYYEVTSFDDISYILNCSIDDDYAMALEDMGEDVSDVVANLVENLKDNIEEEGYDVTRDGYTIDFWKDGVKVYSETRK